MTRVKRGGILAPYKKKIDAMVTQFPELLAVRIWEEISKGPDGFHGSVITVRRSDHGFLGGIQCCLLR
ncbi:MAG TPA: hypothetical protein VMW24_15490 [Sedimentisphaerales bacterium]|nr:hypothetical protein [Sedimentisphaerales bacterium]